ncbi:MAG: IS66 family transposase [Planctomycetota bacterium]|nr:IS66 family transposase [Planctomycetota bacterium]
MSQPPITPEQLASLPPEIRALVRAIIDHYEQQLAELKAELAGLRKTPQNSSLPPSSQHPHAKPPVAKSRSKKKSGGQPGHPKHERTLIPTEQCSEVVPCQPAVCRRCEGQLTGNDPVPLRHQVWELPEIKPLVTEYQLHRFLCPGCGVTTCGRLPPGVPASQAGPRLVALTALLMGCFRQSKRRVALFLEQVLGQPCSPGWVVKLQKQATAALQSPYDQLAKQLPTEDRLGIDETPTKEGSAKAWLWGFVATTYTVFAIRTSRAATILGDLLTEQFSGVVNCDRAKMYWCLGRLQWCWAHLKRDFQALIDDQDQQVKRLGRDLMRPTKAMFRHWARYRDGTITRRGFERLMKPIRREVEALLLRGLFSGNARLMGMCQELYDHRDWLWAFVEIEGIEPTNNASERALRHAVIWRKLSFGTQSAHGSRFVETMLTVVETCRQQSRNTFAFITAAVQAHFSHQPAPGLLIGA